MDLIVIFSAMYFRSSNLQVVNQKKSKSYILLFFLFDGFPDVCHVSRFPVYISCLYNTRDELKALTTDAMMMAV